MIKHYFIGSPEKLI